MRAAATGGIVLLHEAGGDRSQTVAALPTIIDQLRARGCEFVTIDELRFYAFGGKPFTPAENAVYRFYNRTSGTHFYTQSTAEAQIVLDRWWNVYAYEGIAYFVNPTDNADALYRFYNTRTGSHFYTVSAEERDAVIAQWPDLYAYEGVAYYVCATQTSCSSPVYRFYDVSNGSHFYTASDVERDTIIARWSGTYLYEGVAFWVCQ
jgi:hypothetical protein